MSQFLPIWRRMSIAGRPGRRIFSLAVGFRAPYFATIKPRVLELEPGRCVVDFPRRRRVLNHLGTIHAIALCNAAELAAGMATDAIVPDSHRWIPSEMTVKYLAKGKTALRATARVAPLGPLSTRTMEVPTDVIITDAGNEIVATARITMHVSRRVAR